MKFYYIIQSDGSSLFTLPYPEDFIYHCLFSLIDKTDEKFKLLEVPVDTHAADALLCSSGSVVPKVIFQRSLQ